MFNCSIWLRGVVDIQLMELATREKCDRYRHGLAVCIAEVARETKSMTDQGLAIWRDFKMKGKYHFGKGDEGYKEFDQRPLTAMVMQYAGQDTIFMPMLFDHYLSKLRYRKFEFSKLVEMSEETTDYTCGKEYNPQGHGHQMAPRTFWY